MPNPYPRELRVRAVRAYESRTEPYPVIAARFEIGPAHVDALGAAATRDRDRRSARQGRGLGVAGRLGGTQAVDRRQARPDVRGTHPGVQPRGAVWSGTSLQHLASAPPDRVCLQKKRSRPAEQDRARVQAERAAFRVWAQTIEAERLVFLDESGANVAMGRSHAWLPRGQELIEPRPRNWGDNLSLVGAMRLDGWVTLSHGVGRHDDTAVRRLGATASRPASCVPATSWCWTTSRHTRPRASGR